MKILCLVVSPHPDDAELGIGGLIAKMTSRGQEVVLVDLTDGEPTPFGDKVKRKREADRAARALGIKRRINLGFTNRCLFDNPETRVALAEEIRVHRPQILLAPHPRDSHPDHCAAAEIAAAARFWAKLTRTDFRGEPFWPPLFLQYFCSHLKYLPPVSVLIDTGPQFPAKMKSMRCYRSQFIDNPANRFVFDFVRARDAYWGSLVNAAFAEALHCPEAIKVDLPSLLL